MAGQAQARGGAAVGEQAAALAEDDWGDGQAEFVDQARPAGTGPGGRCRGPGGRGPGGVSGRRRGRGRRRSGSSWGPRSPRPRSGCARPRTSAGRSGRVRRGGRSSGASPGRSSRTYGLPRRKASASPSQSPATCSNAASRCGTNQPPRVNPSLVSSSGAPGPWETPSSVRNSCTTSFIADRSFGVCADGVRQDAGPAGGRTPCSLPSRGRRYRRAQSSRWTFVLDACARGRTTSRSMLTWLGRVTAQPIVSATSSAVSGAATPA